MKKFILLFLVLLILPSCGTKEITREVIRPQIIPLNKELLDKRNAMIEQLKTFELKNPTLASIKKTNSNYLIIYSDYFISGEQINKITNQLLDMSINGIQLNNTQAELLKVK